MLTDTQVITEFQRWRAATLRATWIWLLLFVICFGIFGHFVKTADLTLTQVRVMFSSFAIGGFSLIVVTFRVNRLYRCPRCEAVPRGTWGPRPAWLRKCGGVALFPERCPNCGVRLIAGGGA